MSPDTIAMRFRAERKRLGLSHARIATLCGVSKTSVIAWEKGSKIPANALAAIEQADPRFDASFVLSGERRWGVAPVAPAGIDTSPILGTTHPPMTLTDTEVALIEALRALPPEQQEQIRLQVRLLLQHAQRHGESDTTPTRR